MVLLITIITLWCQCKFQLARHKLGKHLGEVSISYPQRKITVRFKLTGYINIFFHFEVYDTDSTLF